MRRNRSLLLIGLILFTANCAGFQRSCAAGCAESLGSDWLIVQMTLDGKPFRCWELEDVSVTNETQSDGVYWQSRDGHLVHISGLYNRVQVAHRGWDEAYAEVGISRETCKSIQLMRYNASTSNYQHAN